MANLKVTTSFQEYSLPSSSRSGNYTSKWAQQDLEYLNEKLSRFSREPSQWDLYKITQVIENKDDYQAQINNLPPFSSAIINEKFINEQNESFNKGDLVYKNIDGTTTHIAAERGGVFYPQKITQKITQQSDDNSGDSNSSSDDNTYDITFSYMTSEPVAGNPKTATKTTTSDKNEWVVDDPSQQIVFPDMPVNKPAGIYGHIFIRTDTSDWIVSFDVEINDNSERIMPIIKMYNNKNEEVYCDFLLTAPPDEASQGEYELSKIPGIVVKVVVK